VRCLTGKLATKRQKPFIARSRLENLKGAGLGLRKNNIANVENIKSLGAWKNKTRQGEHDH
jgi:hypothetical protein